jgi:inorganic pyrophosphatase
MVVEIPRWTNAKFEISTSEPGNPIKQDVKKGEVRFVKNLFPHRGYIWNYGAIPQTWEDPTHKDEGTEAFGDNDPIDAIEIGQRVAQTGNVLEVKVLGVVALLDEGETDWKVIVIDAHDPLAEQLNDIQDVRKAMPGFLEATLDWLKHYKCADGKGVNRIAFNDEIKGADFAKRVIADTHEAWKKLVSGAVPCKTEKYDLCISKARDAALEEKQLPIGEELPEAEKPADVDKSYFIARS